MRNLDLDDIKLAAKTSHIKDFTGNFTSLGGGEVNDTFVLDCETKKVILRVAKEPGLATLKQEARALSLLDIPYLPKLLFFDEHQHLKDRMWIMETYVIGEPVTRLSVNQFRSLGTLLAHVHKTTIQGTAGVAIWDYFLESCDLFGDELFLFHHPDPQLRKLIEQGHDYSQAHQPKFNQLIPSLLHGDATPSNTLTRGDDVSLIDWEFSRFNDPMAEFSTVYYDDMEYNKGKWRPYITNDERAALFAGYHLGGGIIDEERLKLWMNLDKLSAAVFLYWRIYQSARATDNEQLAQYRLDFHNLIESLERNLA